MLPNIPVTAPPTTQIFPYTPPTSNFSISAGIDNKLKTPYSENYSLSLQRALPGGFTLETSYVGRFGRKLIQQNDLATPVNLLDPKSGMTYFQAGAQLAALVDQNYGVKNPTVAPIAYFENLFPQLASAGVSATQAIFTKEFTPYRKVLGESTALADLDFYCSYGCPANAPQNRFFQGQFSSLYVQSTIGSSSYNAGQFVLRHPLSHGFQSDLSYTLGNSIDEGSDTERDSFAAGGVSGYLTNSFNPAQSRGVSDFDTRHLITFTGSYLLPFGRGQAFLGTVSKMTDLLVGGWRLASIDAGRAVCPSRFQKADTPLTGDRQLRRQGRFLCSHHNGGRRPCSKSFYNDTCNQPEQLHQHRRSARASALPGRSGPAQQLPPRWILRSRRKPYQAIQIHRASASHLRLGGVQRQQLGAI